MNSKKSLLLVSFILVQSLHSSLTTLSNYSNQIFSAGVIALAEYQIRTQEKPQFSISSIKLNKKEEKKLAKSFNPQMAKFIYLILSYRELNQKDQNIIWDNSVYQLFNFLELFSFHELFLEKNKNYTKSFNLKSIVLNIGNLDTLSQQNRLQYLFLLDLPAMYCNLENSPLFFADSNLHCFFSSVLSKLFISQLLQQNINLKLGALKDQPLSPTTNKKFLECWQALNLSYMICNTLGILKTPFPNAYHLLPKNIIHCAQQSNFKGYITLFGIDVCQKIGYFIFLRFFLFKIMHAINKHVITPIANFFVPIKEKDVSRENKPNFKNVMFLATTGIIIFGVYEKIAPLLYQRFNVNL